MNLLTSLALAASVASPIPQTPTPVPTPKPKAEVAGSKEAADELARALQFLHSLPSVHMEARARINFKGDPRPDFSFALTLEAPGRFRVRCGESGLLVSDGKQMLHDWFQAVHAIEPAPKSLAEWLREEPSVHFFSITTLRGLLAPSGVSPSLLDAMTVTLLGEETIGDKPALHLAVQDEELRCELWVQKGEEPWILRYRPKWGHVDEGALGLRLYAGDIRLEVESWSRDVPKDAFALVAPKGSRRVDDLAEGVMEERMRYMAEMDIEDGEGEIGIADGSTGDSAGGPTGDSAGEPTGDSAGGSTGATPPAPPAAEKQHPTVGKPAPDVSWTLLNGTSQNLADLKGKVVVLDFWATWCVPCIKGLPKISAVTKNYADQGVVFVACNMQEAKGGVEMFLAKKGLEFDCSVVNQEFANQFGVNGIPHTVMIDRDGVIKKVHIGFGPGSEEHFESDLRELLGLADSAASAAEPSDDSPATAAQAELQRALQFLHSLPSLHMEARARMNFKDDPRPDFSFTLTLQGPDRFRVDPGGAGLLVSDGKQMLQDWFRAVHAVTPAPKSFAEWLRGEAKVDFVSTTTLRGLFAPSGVTPSLLDAKEVALLGEETIGDKPVLHLAVQDEELACELWIQKGEEPWILRYRPQWARFGDGSSKAQFYAGDIRLEVESWSRDVPKDAFALTAPTGSRLVPDLAKGIREAQQRHQRGAGK